MLPFMISFYKETCLNENMHIIFLDADIWFTGCGMWDVGCEC